MPRTNPERRTALADAAVALLATDGVHGVTHRTVERAAGLPTGTAANYVRTREELLVAAADRVVELHLAAMRRIDRTLDVSGSLEPLTDLLAASLEDAVTTSRERYLAIFELQLEARRRPALGAALARFGSVATAFTADEHAALGLDVPPDAVPTLVTLYGGALFSLVSATRDVDRETTRRLARAIVQGTLGARPSAPTR